MPEIPLWKRGAVVAHAIVSPADFARLNAHRWTIDHKGYARRHERKEEYGDRPRGNLLMHREILGLRRGDERQGDHINGDPLDNRRENLRVIPKGTNQQNVHVVTGESHFRGVTRSGSKWRAVGYLDGKRHHIGVFGSEEKAGEEAARWRKENHLCQPEDERESTEEEDVA